LDLAKTELEQNRRPDANALVIVITDGFSRDPAGPQADMLRSERNTKVIAVGVADKLWLYVNWCYYNKYSNREELVRIGGDEKNVYQGMDSSSEVLKVVSNMCGGTDVPNVGTTGNGGGSTTASGDSTTSVATTTEQAVSGSSQLFINILYIFRVCVGRPVHTWCIRKCTENIWRRITH
jgi:hypothetical protein